MSRFIELKGELGPLFVQPHLVAVVMDNHGINTMIVSQVGQVSNFSFPTESAAEVVAKVDAALAPKAEQVPSAWMDYEMGVDLARQPLDPNRLAPFMWGTPPPSQEVATSPPPPQHPKALDHTGAFLLLT